MTENMILLDRSNITEYLKEKMPELDYSTPLDISVVGEGSLETDGDAYLNYVYRVSDGKRRIVLKQSREVGRNANYFDLPADRVEKEYESFVIRNAIAPEYTPDVYFCDKENCVMCEEDISHLKIIRFQMNKDRIYPNFAKQVGEFLAKTHFYTSEYYLETDIFRKAAVHFINHRMRDIFDVNAFVSSEAASDPNGYLVDDVLLPIAKTFLDDPRVPRERFKLRQKYVGHGEALIHADIHTSNIFVSESDMKVIDMEYTFCGPMAYDLGYLAGNIVSQYICAGVRPAASEQSRAAFRKYCLDLLSGMYNEYVRVLTECWEKDAKPLYRKAPGFLEDLKKEILSDMIGFTATTNFHRSCGQAPLPEYDELGFGEERMKAFAVTCLFDHTSLLKRDEYESAEEWAKELADIDSSLGKSI